MTNELWHADIHVDQNLVKNCIEAQCHELVPLTSIKCIDEGWDNVVYLINDVFIFRFPRRKIAVPALEIENQLLRNLQQRFELEIPHPQFIGKPSDIYPYPFQGYKKLIGDTAYQIQLPNQQRIASIKPLSIFLKELHSIHAEEATQLGAQDQLFGRTNQNTFTTLRERIEKIKVKNIIELDDKKIERLFTLASDVKLSDQAKVLVHGDLYCRHLLFNNGKLTGIIDWGDTGISHPAVDLSVIHSFYPPECHDEFFEIYGDVSNDIWTYARFLSMYSELTLILYAHDRHDHLLLAESLNSLKFTLMT